jgi:hypothetical protein
VQVKEQYQVKISNRFAALKNFYYYYYYYYYYVDFNRAWESIRERMEASATETLGYYEIKQHKP